MFLLLSFALYVFRINIQPSYTFFGFLISWTYLRFFQVSGDIKGDHSDSFSFASFFPELLRPFVSLVSGVIYIIVSNIGIIPKTNRKDQHHTRPFVDPNVSSLSDPVDAERRRGLGMKAVESRIAEMKKTLAEKPKDDPTNLV
eukprot:TRINITY_DN2206_c0_g1_i1.p2 TRINITY_DN2206_c0_g1~~TRINITY_DN2206_c0_g1_i1.p2  ORF type:complete len:143 (-),score=31.49 TRINITY_DN2206_c0_g1_i1:153-581(-)